MKLILAFALTTGAAAAFTAPHAPFTCTVRIKLDSIAPPTFFV